MTKQDLIKLRDKMASGKAERFDPLFEFALYPLKNDMNIVYLANDANLDQDRTEGSIDATVAFLEAVLPKCQWQLISNDADDASKARAKLLTFNMMYFTAIADSPARALLLATLDALIERAE